jgi:glycosyltransferase involved in cell wall biosynthesis
VIPTRDEVENVAPLLARLAYVLPDTALEIIFVDDSVDGTQTEIRRVAADHPHDVTVLHREPEQRWGGLGGAVVDGIRHADGTWVCIMDADLQHPPEVIADLVEAAVSRSVDLVVASRYCAAGDTGHFGRVRKLLSRGSAALARVAFPRSLRGVADPMSGFFAVRRDALDLERLRPHGFKILLEILVRTPGLRRSEIPFTFGDREAGNSKANVAEAQRYLHHLLRLRLDGATRFALFGLVGLSGLLVNTLLLAFFTDVGGFYYLLSAALATQGSTLWNWGLTEAVVFQGREHRHSGQRRLAMFFAVNNVALILRVPLLFVLASVLGINYLVANVASLAVMMIGRFMLADSWVWAKTQRPAPGNVYDIHGIISVSSAVALPELEGFRVAKLDGAPTIDVRIGKVATTGPQLYARQLRYDEGLGPAGFATQITMGRRIDIVASQLLRWSPHVLYTNIVEPVLRWTFAERGYALAHAACIAVDDRAYLITARTDTGKTTTILKTLDSQPACSFLSDDLTLLSPDGTVLTYPKPLTISRHTVSAVRTPLLSVWERLTLIVQSRLHSKSGRQFAFFLSRTGLPVATINSIVQAIVPPPKYRVDRLVPGVHCAREARLSGLVVIQRGDEDTSRTLGGAEALTILLENCEDAYGFPPYSDIEAFLHSGNGTDLRTVERETIGGALAGVDATLLTSTTRDWWQQLPGLIDPRLRGTPQALEDTSINAPLLASVQALSRPAEETSPVVAREEA